MATRSKLAVILHADVVGSTALVQADERLAHERIRDAFQQLSETIVRYGGTPHEVRGDALVAELDRASDAVSAALAFQAENFARNRALAGGIRPEVRIGIALGEVVIADETVTGAGVVLAQRLEQLADAGGVCLQGSVYEAVPRRLPFAYTSLGEQMVKGFEEPVRAYTVALQPGEVLPEGEDASSTEARARGGSPARIAAIAISVILVAAAAMAWLQPWRSASQTTERSPDTSVVASEAEETERAPPAGDSESSDPALPSTPSIVVLSFVNISGSAEQEYFADGMTEDITTDLSKLSDLFVISRTSAFTYKGRSLDVKEVGRELGVRFVLEGSVRRAADQLRINAQLIDALTGGHVWADRYDGSLTNVFAFQDQITSKIVAALAVHLSPDEQRRRHESEIVGPDAYDAFLKGWGRLALDTPEDTLQAIQHFEQALALNPKYGRAHAALAQAYWSLESRISVYQLSVEFTYFEIVRLVLDHLRKAREQGSWHAHALRARLLQRQRRFAEAMGEAEQAVALAPSNANAYEVLAELLIYSGRTDEAGVLIEKALRLDPKLPAEKYFLRALALFASGRPEDALSEIRRARGHNPNPTRYAAIEAASLATLGQTSEAKVALDHYLAGYRGLPALNGIMLEWPFANAETAERLAEALVSAGLTRSAQPYYLVSEHDRLSGEEIASLLFGETIIGTDNYNKEEMEVTRDESGQITSQGWITFFDDGASRIDGDALCDPWDTFGDYCVAIFRNPTGARERNDEYLLYTIPWIIAFSVQQ